MHRIALAAPGPESAEPVRRARASGVLWPEPNSTIPDPKSVRARLAYGLLYSPPVTLPADAAARRAFGSLWRMVPADNGQVTAALRRDNERRWAWRWPLVGRAYMCPSAGVFTLRR